MADVITVTNAKGGSGKTTTANTLATELARRGYRVLLVDLDPQSSQTQLFGLSPYSFEGTEHDIARIFRLVDEGMPVPVNVRENLDLLPSRPYFVPQKPNPGDELSLYTALHGHHVVGEGLKEWYDFVIIDTGGHTSLESLMGVLAADWLLIPFKPSFLDETGLQITFRYIVDIAKRYIYNFRARLLGFVATNYGSNYKEDTARLVARREDFRRIFSGSKIAQLIRPAFDPERDDPIIGTFPTRSVWGRAFGIPQPVREYIEEHGSKPSEVLAEIDMFVDKFESLVGSKINGRV